LNNTLYMGSSVAAKTNPVDKVTVRNTKPLNMRFKLLMVRFIESFSKISYCHARR